MIEPAANLAGLSAPMIATLIALHRRGAAERHRNFYIHHEHVEHHQLSVVTALCVRGLAVVAFSAGRHRVQLTEQGHWYARSAIARWSEMLAA